MRFVASANAMFGFTVWVKNIFTPMYGQHDLAGRVISIIVRLGNIVVRGVVMALACAAAVILFAAWIVLPVIIVMNILYFIYT